MYIILILILILIWDVIRNTESIITTKLITGNKIIHSFLMKLITCCETSIDNQN